MALRPYTKAVVTMTNSGTAYQLNSTPSTYASTIQIMADPNNTGVVYYGDSTVTTTTGMGALSAKDSVMISHPTTQGFHEAWDLSTIYVVSTASGDKVRVMTSEKI